MYSCFMAFKDLLKILQFKIKKNIEGAHHKLLISFKIDELFESKYFSSYLSNVCYNFNNFFNP